MSCKKDRKKDSRSNVELYSEPCQTSEMGYFAKIIKLLNVLAKRSILEVLKDSHCGSGMRCLCLLKARAPYPPVFINSRHGLQKIPFQMLYMVKFKRNWFVASLSTAVSGYKQEYFQKRGQSILNNQIVFELRNNSNFHKFQKKWFLERFCPP